MAHRIGLLTLPLHTNYGGIIQIVALYQYLNSIGKEPVFLFKKPVRPFLERSAINLLSVLPGQNLRGIRGRAQKRNKHLPFINKYMPRQSMVVRTSEELEKAVKNEALDAVIVGSDQVWRPEFHFDDNPYAYFLDFAQNVGVPAISYAASFGHSTWKNPELKEDVGALLRRFKSIAVRETSGLKICQESFGCEKAQVVADPTLLVNPSFYHSAAASEPIYTGKTVLKYVLDESPTVSAITRTILYNLPGDMLPFSLGPSDTIIQYDLGQWLRAFKDAEFIVTDSYHGTIFSIIFKKNFICIPNINRGLDRFTTLLDHLDLTSRMCRDDEPRVVKALVDQPIDYSQVDKKLGAYLASSTAFLATALAS